MMVRGSDGKEEETEVSGYTKIGIYVPSNAADVEKILSNWRGIRFLQVYEIRHVKIFVGGTKMDAIAIEAVVLSRSAGHLAREISELFNAPDQVFTPVFWGVTKPSRGL